MAIEISDHYVWPSDGSANWSFGGLYTECTTTPNRTIVFSFLWVPSYEDTSLLQKQINHATFMSNGRSVLVAIPARQQDQFT